MNELRCGTCYEWQPLDQFQPDPKKSRGYRQTCRRCRPWIEPEKVKPKARKAKYSKRVAYAMCGKKIGFRKKESALAAALSLARVTTFTRVYQCPICTRWHVTHKGEKSA